MALKGNSNRYGPLVATLHWLSAVTILALLALGFLAAHASDASQTTALLQLHVPLGALVLALTLTRIVWWFFDTRPDDAAEQPHWQALAAHVTHMLLYGLLLIMGASGIGLMVLSGAAPTLFFGASGALPRFSEFAPMAVHAFGAFAIIVLLCLHISAALYHQFYRRDRLFARMGMGQAQDTRND